MKKSLLLISLITLLSACTHSSSTKFSYSGEFKLTFPGELLEGATIFSSDELSLKTKEGVLVSGKVISNENEGLPSNMDIRDYPGFLLGLKPVDELEADIKTLFVQSMGEINVSYGLDNLKVNNDAHYKIYSLCEDDACIAYVVNPNFSDHILTVSSQGLSEGKFNKILQGGLNVNE